MFEKRSNIILSPIQTSILSFVNNSLFIFQEKSYKKLNKNLFCNYNIIFSLFNQFGLVIKHDKLEIFHFSRLTNILHISLLNL